MDKLFTPEVIEQILALLQNATDQGATVVIVWLLLPLFVTIVIASGWLLGIHIVAKTIKCLVTAIQQVELDKEKAKRAPQEWKINDVTINDAVATDLRAFLRTRVTSSAYLHRDDLDKLKQAWDEYERAKDTKKDN